MPPVVHVKIGATELELQEFTLWELRVKHDMEQLLSWSKVMQDRDTQTYYKTSSTTSCGQPSAEQLQRVCWTNPTRTVS